MSPTPSPTSSPVTSAAPTVTPPYTLANAGYGCTPFDWSRGFYESTKKYTVAECYAMCLASAIGCVEFFVGVRGQKGCAISDGFCSEESKLVSGRRFDHYTLNNVPMMKTTSTKGPTPTLDYFTDGTMKGCGNWDDTNNGVLFKGAHTAHECAKKCDEFARKFTCKAFFLGVNGHKGCAVTDGSCTFAPGHRFNYYERFATAAPQTSMPTVSHPLDCTTPKMMGTFGTGVIFPEHPYSMAWDGDVRTYADAQGTTFSTGAYFKSAFAIKSFYFHPRTDNDGVDGRLKGAKLQAADSETGPWTELAEIGAYTAGIYNLVNVANSDPKTHYRILFDSANADYGSVAEIKLCDKNPADYRLVHPKMGCGGWQGLGWKMWKGTHTDGVRHTLQKCSDLCDEQPSCTVFYYAATDAQGKNPSGKCALTNGNCTDQEGSPEYAKYEMRV